MIANMPPEPEWIVEPLLLPESFMHFYGREGKGKSRILYQLAHSVVTGTSWLGFLVRKTGKVLYLELDMGVRELAKLIHDAKEVGLATEGILVSESRPYVNVLDPAHARDLAALNEQHNPVVVIVDTADESYDVPIATNEVVTNVIRKFRLAFPQAGLVFVNHEKKASEFTADDLLYLGASKWSRGASSVVQLKAVNQHEATLSVFKVRAHNHRNEIKLERSEESKGFFSLAEWTLGLALQAFPDCLPNPAAAASCETKADVYRLIAAALGNKSSGAVKMEHKRLRDNGEYFQWEARFEEN